MQTELEVKILDVNIEGIKLILEKLQASYKWSKMMKRYVYNFNPIRQWSRVRLRDNWNQTTLTIKEISSDNIDWTKELEIVVDSFEKTHEILKKLWYKEKAYQENRRTSYDLMWVNIEIDERPMIPPYIEIEWNSTQEIEDIVSKLGYSMNQITAINTNKIYLKYWIDIETISFLSFEGF